MERGGGVGGEEGKGKWRRGVYAPPLRKFLDPPLTGAGEKPNKRLQVKLYKQTFASLVGGSVLVAWQDTSRKLA